MQKVNVRKIHVNVTNKNKNDIKQQELFIQAVELAKIAMKLRGNPVPGYDAERQKAYLEYSDKRKVYIE